MGSGKAEQMRLHCALAKIRSGETTVQKPVGIRSCSEWRKVEPIIPH